MHMESLERVHDTINIISEDPRVNVSKIDDYTFNIVIDGELMDSFDKLGEIQKRLMKVVLMITLLKPFMVTDKMQNLF